MHLHEFQVDLEHQSKVTSNDVQQMLLTGPSSIDEEQPPQPVEEDIEQSQQRPAFSIPSSLEPTESTEE